MLRLIILTISSCIVLPLTGCVPIEIKEVHLHLDGGSVLKSSIDKSSSVKTNEILLHFKPVKEGKE